MSNSQHNYSAAVDDKYDAMRRAAVQSEVKLANTLGQQIAFRRREHRSGLSRRERMEALMPTYHRLACSAERFSAHQSKAV